MAIEWRTAYDRYGDASVVAGETVGLELDLEQPDGAGGWQPQSLTDRVFVQRVVDLEGVVLAEALGAIITDEGTPNFVRLVLDGDATKGLLTNGARSVDLRYELAEVLTDGRDVLQVGKFCVTLVADPAASLPSPGGVPGGASVRFTVQQGARGRVVVRYVGAPGRDGLNAPSELKTAGFTAQAGRRYLFDTTTSGFTAPLPANPSTGDAVEFEDAAGACDTHPVIIGRSGHTIGGEASDFSFNVAWGACRFTYSGSTWLYRRN